MFFSSNYSQLAFGAPCTQEGSGVREGRAGSFLSGSSHAPEHVCAQLSLVTQLHCEQSPCRALLSHYI